jgi:MoxR-like ATPase
MMRKDVDDLHQGASVTDAIDLPNAEWEAVTRLNTVYRGLTEQVGRVIVGQQAVLDELLIAMLAGGHALLVGVPGLAKTLMVRTLAETLDMSFARVQFTPDLMPADITGTEVIQEDKLTGTRTFRFLPGPIFANVVLADEINRTPPKTQAALLEAMQERQVTVGGQRHELPRPFFVLATQNPIEQEGTYPLPEAQLDRFLFQILVDYPSEDEEFQIVRQTTLETALTVQRLLSQSDWQELQQAVRRVAVADSVVRYALQLSRATRPKTPQSPTFVSQYVSWGAGPRASQAMVMGAKARALLQGRPYVSPDDIRAVATPVLRHRLVLNFNAEADGLRPDDLIARLIAATPEHPAPPAVLPAIFQSSRSSV